MCPGPNSGAGPRVGGPKKNAEFLLHALKSAESRAEPEGLWLWSRPVNKAAETQHRNYRASGALAHALTLPTTLS